MAAHSTVIEWLVQRARPYIYTTAAAPALSHVLMASMDIIAGEEGAQRRTHLRALIGQLRTELDLQRWKLFPSNTAIQRVIIGANDEAMRAAPALYDKGCRASALRRCWLARCACASPCRLRIPTPRSPSWPACSICWRNSDERIDRLFRDRLRYRDQQYAGVVHAAACAGAGRGARRSHEPVAAGGTARRRMAQRERRPARSCGTGRAAVRPDDAVPAA